MKWVLAHFKMLLLGLESIIKQIKYKESNIIGLFKEKDNPPQSPPWGVIKCQIEKLLCFYLVGIRCFGGSEALSLNISEKHSLCRFSKY